MKIKEAKLWFSDFETENNESIENQFNDTFFKNKKNIFATSDVSEEIETNPRPITNEEWIRLGGKSSCGHDDLGDPIEVVAIKEDFHSRFWFLKGMRNLSVDDNKRAFIIIQEQR